MAAQRPPDLEIYPVSRAVNSPNDRPNCSEPVAGND